jgi:hypothetical protein
MRSKLISIAFVLVPHRPVTQCACSCGQCRCIQQKNHRDFYSVFVQISRCSTSVVQMTLFTRPMPRFVARQSNRCENTSLGSRVGVVFSFKQQSIRVHCILNGQDYGPLAILRFGSPLTGNGDSMQPVSKRHRTCATMVNEHVKLWAFVDVYGATKRVRVIQLYGGQRFYTLNESSADSHLFSNSVYTEKSLPVQDSCTSPVGRFHRRVISLHSSAILLTLLVELNCCV